MAARFWVGGSGSWNDTSRWSATSGGASGASVPTSADTVTIDGNSGTGILTTTNGATCSTLTINSSTLGVTLGADLTVTGITILTAGTLDLSGKTLITGSFNSDSTSVRTLNFNGGAIDITGSNAIIYNTNTLTNLTILPDITTGLSRNVRLIANATVGTRTIAAGTISEPYAVDWQVTAGSDIVALASGRHLNFTGFSGTWSNSYRIIYGNLILSNAMTVSGGGNSTTFSSISGSINSITTNGKLLDFSIVFDGIGGTWRLQDALTVGSTRTTTLTNGTLDLNGKTLSTGLYSSSNSNIRTFNFNGGEINLTGSNATIYFTNTLTNLTILPSITSGLPRIVRLIANATTGTRTIGAGSGGGEPYVLDWYIAAGTDTVAVPSARDFNCTGFSGTINNATRNIYGNYTLSDTVTMASGTLATTFISTTGGSKTITTKDRFLDFPIAFNGAGADWQLQDNITVSSTYTTTLTAGTLNLNNKILTTGLFSSSNTNARTLSFGNAGRVIITGNSGTVWNTANATNFETTGSKDVEFYYTGSVGTRSINQGSTTGDTELNAFNVIVTGNGTDVVSLNTSTSYLNVDFYGFNGTWTNTSVWIYGNLVLGPNMIVGPGANTVSLRATSGIKTITTNGKVIEFAIGFNGLGGTWVLNDAMTMGSTRDVILINGTLDLNGKTLSVNYFSTGTGTKNLTFNGGTLNVNGATTVAFNNAQPTGFTTTAGSGIGQITMTADAAKTFAGNGSTYAATLNQGGAGTLTITGRNTFAGASNTYSGATTIIFPAGVTTTFTGSLNLKGSSSGNVTIDSSTGTTSATLAKVNGIADCDYLSYKNTIVTGDYWYAGTNSIDNGNNVGWTQRSAAPHKAGFWHFFGDIISV